MNVWCIPNVIFWFVKLKMGFFMKSFICWLNSFHFLILKTIQSIFQTLYINLFKHYGNILVNSNVTACVWSIQISKAQKLVRNFTQNALEITRNPLLQPSFLQDNLRFLIFRQKTATFLLFFNILRWKLFVKICFLFLASFRLESYCLEFKEIQYYTIISNISTIKLKKKKIKYFLATSCFNFFKRCLKLHEALKTAFGFFTQFLNRLLLKDLCHFT